MVKIFLSDEFIKNSMETGMNTMCNSNLTCKNIPTKSLIYMDASGKRRWLKKTESNFQKIIDNQYTFII